MQIHVHLKDNPQAKTSPWSGGQENIWTAMPMEGYKAFTAEKGGESPWGDQRPGWGRRREETGVRRNGLAAGTEHDMEIDDVGYMMLVWSRQRADCCCESGAKHSAGMGIQGNFWSVAMDVDQRDNSKELE